MRTNINLIKYNNDFQSINITALTKWEFKIWMYLLLNVRDKRDQSIVISFEEIRNNIGITLNNKDIYKWLENTSNKLISQNITIINSDNTNFKKFSFFNEFEADSKNGTLTVQVNKKFLYVVNELIRNYSVLIWEDIQVLKSKYSLQMYKLVREFKKQEILEFTIDKFKTIFNIKNKVPRYINDKVLNPIKKELPSVIKNFKLEKIKDNKTSPVKKIRITWKYISDKELLYLNDKNINEIEDFTFLND